MQLTGKGIIFTWKDKKSGSSATFSKEKNEEIYKNLSGKTAVVAEVKKTKKTSQAEVFMILQIFQETRISDLVFQQSRL